jgi:hypothetical protein
MKLCTNRELYDWLVFLASRLKVLGSEELSKDADMAARTLITFPIAKFLGDSRIALRHVLAEENGLLSHDRSCRSSECVETARRSLRPALI